MHVFLSIEIILLEYVLQCLLRHVDLFLEYLIVQWNLTCYLFFFFYL